jgi:hypothetical protein
MCEPRRDMRSSHGRVEGQRLYTGSRSSTNWNLSLGLAWKNHSFILDETLDLGPSALWNLGNKDLKYISLRFFC